jgi:flagellar export protein FliJ
MKKFKFNLNTLLKFRQAGTRILQQELSQKQREIELLLGNEKQLREQIILQEEEMTLRRKDGEFASQAMHDRYLQLLHVSLCELPGKVEAKQLELEQARRKIFKAFQKRKIVEKLKEKKYSHWKNELEKEEPHEHTRRGS